MKMSYEDYKLEVGDKVKVTRHCFWYDDEFHVGDTFVIEEQHVNHGFEKYVEKMND